MGKENIVFVLRPGSLDNIGIQKTGVMLPTLFGMSKNFFLIVVLKVKFLRYDFPLVLGFSILSKMIIELLL